MSVIYGIIIKKMKIFFLKSCVKMINDLFDLYLDFLIWIMHIHLLLFLWQLLLVFQLLLIKRTKLKIYSRLEKEFLAQNKWAHSIVSRSIRSIYNYFFCFQVLSHLYVLKLNKIFISRGSASDPVNEGKRYKRKLSYLCTFYKRKI